MFLILFYPVVTDECNVFTDDEMYSQMDRMYSQMGFAILVHTRVKGLGQRYPNKKRHFDNAENRKIAEKVPEMTIDESGRRRPTREGCRDSMGWKSANWHRNSQTLGFFQSLRAPVPVR